MTCAVTSKEQVGNARPHAEVVVGHILMDLAPNLPGPRRAGETLLHTLSLYGEVNLTPSK